MKVTIGNQFISRFLLCSAICMMFSVIGSNAYAQAIQDINYKYYDFVVRNADADLAKAARAASPIVIDGRVYQGSAQTATKINYLFEIKHGQCYLTYHEVKVKAQVTLPRMIGGNSEQKRRFDLYVKKIIDHEHRHVSIAMNHANDLYREVAGLRPERTCRTMWERIEQLRKKHTDAGDVENKNYDRRTDHGRYE